MLHKLQVQKVLNFNLTTQNGPVLNVHSIQLRDKILLFQIPNDQIRRFVYDAFALTIAGHTLTDDDLFVRDYLYMKSSLHSYTAEFELLCTDSSVVFEKYQWNRKWAVDPVHSDQQQVMAAYQRLIARTRCEHSWRSSLEWDENEVTLQNNVSYVSHLHQSEKPVVLLEVENSSAKLISDLFDCNGQIIIISENIENIVLRMATLAR
jgi:hypothetical protein